MNWLLDRGAPVDTRSAEGATPLMNAVQARNASYVELLLARGADPNAQDLRGFTALHRAAEMGETAIVRALVASGADPNAEALGHTALSFAQKRGHDEIVRLLGEVSPG
jgi:ankyrin repeat protein